MSRRESRHLHGAALTTVCLALLATSGVVTARAQDDGDLTDGQIIALREARHVTDSVGGEIWEGWDRAAKPTLIVGREHEFLVGLPDPSAAPASFSPIERRFQGRRILRRARTLPATLRTAFPVDGVPTAVVGAWRADVETPNEWAVTLGQAWFQVLQLQRGEQDRFESLQISRPDLPSWQVDYEFPYSDPDVGNAMRLLGQSLYEFWANGARLPRESQRTFAAESAWAALQNLRAIITLKHGMEAWHFFQFTTWKDGVARYTGIHLARGVARAEVLEEFEHVHGFQLLETGQSYTRMWEETVRSRYWLIRTSGRPGERDRTALFALGHGIAELLDAIHPDWKERYFEPGVWLDDLVVEAMESAGGTS